MAKKILINAQPPIALYDSEKPSTPDMTFPNLIDVTDIIKELSRDGGEVANITVNIDNVNGDLTRYLNGWFNAIAEYWQDDVNIFEGTVSTIKSDTTLQLTVVA